MFNNDSGVLCGLGRQERKEVRGRGQVENRRGLCKRYDVEHEAWLELDRTGQQVVTLTCRGGLPGE